MTTVPTAEELTGVCPACGAGCSPGDRFCEDCGASLRPADPAVPQCVSCGASGLDADGFCRVCGIRSTAGDRREIDMGVAAAVTDRGKHHARNEDAMALRVLESSGTVVLVICDGVSSSDRADEAAELAATAAAEQLVGALRSGRGAEAAIEAAIAVAADAVADLGDRAHPGDHSPACTLVCAVLTGDAVTVCSIGDSRAYWLADVTAPTSAQRLTRDDSVAAGLVAVGVDEVVAMSMPDAHTITAWLGADADALSPVVRTFVPTGPGAVLLCSDGLWNYFPGPDELSAIALPPSATTPLSTAHRLADLALAAGGSDNITVAVAPFPATPRNSRS